MGFMDTVKQQFNKNKHKVAPVVDKATDQIDKVTKGKSSSITSKVDDAARKISGDSTAATSTTAATTDTDPSTGTDSTAS